MQNVTKLHILHSVQSSPSLFGNKQFLEVSRFMALLRGPERHESGQHQQVDPFAFPLVTSVSVLSPDF